MARGRARQVVFRIFYSTSFTIVFLLTVGFACAGPADMIYQSYRRRRWIDMFMLAGIYFLTGVLASFLYASRLYTNRSVLKDIPKTFIPVDKGELPAKKVWRLIEDCKNRSAAIAYLARPRARRVEIEVSYTQARIKTLLQPEHSKDTCTYNPEWGTISHPGWSGPTVKEMPNLDYSVVVAELTDLIEARAVSLAPNGPTTPRDGQQVPVPDDYVLEALSRPEESGMRQYINQLLSLNVLENNSLTVTFLDLYERARFAPEPLSEEDFNNLMRIFAEVLRTMKALDISLLDIPDDFDDSGSESMGSIVAPRYALHHDPLPTSHTNYERSSHIARNLSTAQASSTTSLASSIAGSVRRLHPLQNQRTIHIHSPTAVPPRISNDSVRSLSSQDVYFGTNLPSPPAHAPPQDGPSWAEPTSQPPFFSVYPSQLKNRPRSRSRGGNNNAVPGTDTNVHTANNDEIQRQRRSRLKRTLSRRSVESNRTGKSSLLSLRSTKAGSVIRLNREFTETGLGVPYEYADGDGERSVTGLGVDLGVGSGNGSEQR